LEVGFEFSVWLTFTGGDVVNEMRAERTYPTVLLVMVGFMALRWR
jgi:hypothetical protein